MNKANRAAQFAPFDALKGLQQALKDKEERHSRTERKELPEELAAALSLKISRAEKGDAVSVIFYQNGHYVSLFGSISEKNIVDKYLAVDGKRIYFEELADLQSGRETVLK